MKEGTRSIFTYIFLFFVLLAILALISPDQFQILANAFSQTGELIVVLLVIAVIVYILRRAREI